MARAGADEVLADHSGLAANPIVTQMLGAFPGPAMILNAGRHVVLANRKMAELSGLPVLEIVGSRPGEALHCVHASETDEGCGSTKFCTQCGIPKALTAHLASHTAEVEECRITRSTTDGPAAFDLRVRVSPLSCKGQFTVVALQDITDEKRRAVLERLFFHDVLNTVGGMKGVIDLMPHLTLDELPEMSRVARHLVVEIKEVIESQRDLMAAERADLRVNIRELDPEDVLLQLCALYSHHTAGFGKTILPLPLVGSHSVRSDEVLLRRVLSNLVKNALEASAPGQTVKIGFHYNGGPSFFVHNQSVMPPAVQLQVFQRSFSTKAATGRGTGTYSAKLLTECYLGGSISFESSAARGTTFTVRLAP